MSELIRGRTREPLNIFIFAPPGMGKTSFMSGAPNAVLVGPEENGEFDGLKLKSTSYAHFMKQLDDIYNGKYKSENIQTVGIDSIDMVQSLIFKQILDKEPGKTMETACKGYGKAYAQSKMELIKVKDKLKMLRDQRGLNIVVIGHAIKRLFPDPILGMEYIVWEPTLHRGKNDDHNQIFLEWASAVFFINNKNYSTDPEQNRFAVSQGERELLTEFRPSHCGKNRFNLPYSIPLDRNIYANWPKLMSYIDDFYAKGARVDMSRQELEAAIFEFKDAMGKVRDESYHVPMEKAFLENQTNVQNLKALTSRVREIVANQ